MTRTEELILRSQAGDEDAKRSLVDENNGLIWSVARRFIGRGADMEDLYQLGCLGFLKAVDGFDTNAKMNPPLRGQDDVEAIIEGLCDGTIDAIITDHAPHHIDEKNLEFDYALNGIVGLETSLALSITYLVKTGRMTLAEMLKKMTYNPSDILNLGLGEIALGAIADLTIFDPDEIWTVEVDAFHSKSKNSPYDGYTLSGKAHMTIVEGKVMYEN